MPVVRAAPDAPTRSPYQEILGEAFASLHPHVRRAHETRMAAEGRLDVEHGSHWSSPLLIRLMTLPAAGRGQRVRLDVAPAGDEVEWVRHIGASVLRTRQRARGSLLVERHGPGEVSFELEVEDGALRYRQVAIGAAGLAVPRFMSPLISARVSPTTAGWYVDVSVTWRGHLVCHYAGALGVL